MCEGAGVLRWRQPFPDGVLRDLEHPCPNGCGAGWKHPAGANQQVVTSGDDEEVPVRRRGRAAEANDLGGDFVGRVLKAWGFTD
jgi:hypothetical protein